MVGGSAGKEIEMVRDGAGDGVGVGDRNGDGVGDRQQGLMLLHSLPPTQACTGTISCSSSSRPGITRSSWAPTAPLEMTGTSPTACSAWATPPSKLREPGGRVCPGAR